MTAEQLDEMIEEINNEILDLKDDDVIFPTTFAYVQEAFDVIIIPTGRKNSGTIRTYDEALSFMKKKFGENVDYSYQEYCEQLSGLINQIYSYFGGDYGLQ